jgi:3-hydroxy-3-methylglutaryl CoA synthase/uncharacterized OB-fold protein
MSGITGYGAYLPYYRLERSRIGATLGGGAGKGTRAVAASDEDSTSMAVEAARLAMPDPAGRAAIRQFFLATANPPYLDKTNATAVHAALGLATEALAIDMAGAVRSGVGALLAGAQSPVCTLAVLSDLRTGLPGGADEREGGDGAAAFVFGGAGPVLAEIVAHAAATEEFLERWRLPGARSSRVWEERFGEDVYAPLVDVAVADALKAAALTPDQIDHLIVSGLHGRAVRAAATAAVKAAGVRPEAVADDLTTSIGNPGTAQPGILLANVLDQAAAGQHILLVTLADGVTAIVVRTSDALPAHRPAKPVATQLAEGNPNLSYSTFLTWRGFLDREPPRRPDPDPPYAPPALRRADWKFGFVTTRCGRCGTRSLPPARVCPSCRAVDEMVAEPLAELPATVATYAIDHLAYTVNPPLLVVVIDFDGGGRFRCELTDAAADVVHIGMRVAMTFRRVVTAGGIHNYFWKARPIRG